MSFQTYLEQSSREINKELAAITKKWDERIQRELTRLKEPHDLFLTSISGGKMLRGTLVKLGYELANGSMKKAIIKPAIAYEILHTGFLIHDDIIDASPLRRGKPTIYKALGGNHYGISQALCLGDMGFFLANKLLTESNFPEKERNKAVDLLSDIAVKTILGEMLDIKLSHSPVKKEDDVLTIHQMKTAYYTITGPLSLGVILAGGSKELLRLCSRFGETLGTAFQIQDDILGVFGDEKILGKSVTSDIEEGKNTLLIAYASQKANSEQRTILQRYYGKGTVDIKVFEELKNVFIDTGSLAYSKEKLQSLTVQARVAIPLLTRNKKMNKLLYELTDFLIMRNK